MRLRIRTQLILAFLVTVLLPLIGTGLYGNWITSQTLQTQALDNAQADLHLRALQIEGVLKNIRENVLFLSQLDSLATFINEDNYSLEAKQPVIRDFVSFSATHPEIFQTRYIDSSGMEVIRIEVSETGITTVSEPQLQNKSTRYYFAAVMALQNGEVFVSPVDLNREFDQLQIPYTPTIRYATPVFRADGERAGLVIINLYASPFLSLVQNNSAEGAVLYLLDQDGYYLSHPDVDKLWGNSRDLGTGVRFPEENMPAWELINQLASGVHSPPPDTWVEVVRDQLLPVSLLPGINTAEPPRSVFVFQRVPFNITSSPTWTLVEEIPHVSLFAPIWNFRLTAILILLLASIVSMVIAINLSRRLSNPIIRLTLEVRQFVQTRLGERNTVKTRIRDPQRNETQELMHAFQDMSSTIDSHLEQLAMLNRAGNYIAARLDRPAVLEASCYAIDRILPVKLISISLNNEVLQTCGDLAWSVHRESSSVATVLENAMEESDWRTVGLSAADGPPGFLCCTPICVDGVMGIIEIYGNDPILGKASSGDLLATLATQISISLDNADLYARLEKRKAELQTLVKQLINAQEEERKVVAYDIHDGLIQMLVGARLHLRNFEADREQAPERSESALQKGLDQLGAAVVEARRVIDGLRPAALDDLGLVTTLREIAEETQTACQCRLEFVVEPANLRVPAHIETTAFRIGQEALTNARKYAHSPRIRIVLSTKNDALLIEVQDWGLGFDQETLTTKSSQENRGMGLLGMQERARLVGGECTIESYPGKGTRIHAVLPFEFEETL